MKVDLNDLLLKAREFGLYSVLVEGGGRVATSFLKARLVDKLIIISAPILIGRGKNAVEELGVNKISEAIKFKDFYTETLGQDQVFVGYPRWS
jgi:diaminohydroxyphosphoribosylaminopyrimidine deaminase/5-amino-6-(5-phosphoribosylamino)uracil reductase